MDIVPDLLNLSKRTGQPVDFRIASAQAVAFRFVATFFHAMLADCLRVRLLPHVRQQLVVVCFTGYQSQLRISHFRRVAGGEFRVQWLLVLPLAVLAPFATQAGNGQGPQSCQRLSAAISFMLRPLLARHCLVQRHEVGYCFGRQDRSHRSNTSRHVCASNRAITLARSTLDDSPCHPRGLQRAPLAQHRRS